MKITKSTGDLSSSRKFLYICRQFGFDPVNTVRAIRNLFWYFRSLREFVSLSEKVSVDKVPTLLDKNSQSGAGDGHYFWQDLICARWIYEQKPTRHFDVGSRVDGFIAHLLTFMEVIVLDVRPLELEIPRLQVILGNAQKELVGHLVRYESVSSLHSIEHFGLGRYGDELDFLGHEKGLLNISECVEPGGLLYLSFPIGVEAIEFNSQRVVDPMWVVEKLSGFSLEEFVLIPWRGKPIFDISPNEVDVTTWGQAGLYKFRRNF